MGTDFDCDGGLIQAVSPTLDQRAGRSGANSFATSGGLVPVPHAAISPALKARDHKGVSSDGDGDGDGAILVPMSVALRGRDGGATAELGDDLAFSLRASSGGGDKPHVLAFPERMSGTQCASTEDLAPSMGALNPTAIAIQGTLLNRSDTAGPAGPAGSGINENGISFTQTKTDVHAVAYGMAVRRLTPTECERLQGFPDEYTQVPHRNKPAADGPRYKALGNSWAVPVAHWIGRRIDAVEAIHAQKAREAA